MHELMLLRVRACVCVCVCVLMRSRASCVWGVPACARVLCKWRVQLRAVRARDFSCASIALSIRLYPRRRLSDKKNGEHMHWDMVGNREKQRTWWMG